MRLKSLTTLMFFIFLIAVATARTGMGHNRGRMMSSKGNGFYMSINNLLRDIDLSDSQVEKIEKIKTDSKKKLIKIGAELAELNIELKEEMFKEKIDESKIKSILKKINKVSSKMFEERILSKVKILKVLTPEQRKKIKRNYIMGSGWMNRQRRR